MEDRRLWSGVVSPLPPQPAPPAGGGGSGSGSAGSGSVGGGTIVGIGDEQNALGASSLAVGADGNLWFTDSNNNAIGRQTPGGAVTEFAAPTQDAWPDQIVAGSDGNLWFEETGTGQVGRITPAGRVTEFPLPSSDDYSYGIAAGPGGNVWFVDGGSNEIGRITSAGKVTEYPIVDGSSAASDSSDGSSITLLPSIVVGANGDVWAGATDDNGDGLLYQLSSTGRVLNSIALPTYPESLASGPDGAIWVGGDGEIDRINPADAKVASFPLPSSDSSAYDLVSGPDGALWFATEGNDAMGRMTTDGKVIEFNLPGAQQYASINALVSGPGNQLWYATDWSNTPVGSFNPYNALVAGGLDATATAGATSAVTVASFTDMSAGSTNASFYKASIDWGDGTTSDGVITANASGGFDVSATRTWTIESNNVTVTITDVRPAADDPGGLAGRTAIAYGTLTASAPPAQGTGVAISATAGQLFNGVVARYTGVALNSLSSYSATIDWGDGHVTDGTIAADGQGGVTISGSNRYATAGSYTVQTNLFPWAGKWFVPVPAGAAGGTAIGVVSPGGAVKVAGPTPVSTLAGGAGNATPGAAPNGSSTTGALGAGGSVVETPPIALPPIMPPTGLGDGTSSTATVAAGAMNGTGYSLLASSKQTFTGIVASFTLPNSSAAGDLSHFHATIDWNDPATRDWFTLPLPPIIGAPIASDGQGGFTVSATQDFTQYGLYHYQVLISDDRLGTGDAAIVGAAYGQLVVDTPFRPVPLAVAGSVSAVGGASAKGATGASARNGAPAALNPALGEHVKTRAEQIHATSNRPFSGDVGTLKGVIAAGANLSALSGTIDWGDGTAPSAATFVKDKKGLIHVRGAHTFASGGAKAVTVSLTQSLLGKRSSTVSSNSPIHLPLLQTRAHVTGRAGAGAGSSSHVKYHASPVTIHAVAGQLFQGSVGSFAGAPPASGQTWQASIAWGDGTISAGTIQSTGTDQWQVMGSHDYAKKGRRAIHVIVAQSSSGAAATAATHLTILVRINSHAVVASA